MSDPIGRQIKAAVEASAAEAASTAIERIVADGIEFRATERVLADWFLKHNIAVHQARNNRGELYDHAAAFANGLRFEEGAPDHWVTYHEMLADLLCRIDAKAKGETP